MPFPISISLRAQPKWRDWLALRIRAKRRIGIPAGYWRGKPMRSAVQRAARSLRVSRRGAEHGAFVLSSKNGVGRARPRIHQPNIFDARRTETPNDGGAVGVGGSGPTAERS